MLKYIIFFFKNLSLYRLRLHPTHHHRHHFRLGCVCSSGQRSLIRTLIKQHCRLPPTYAGSRRRLYLVCSICVQITTFGTINPFLMHLTMSIFTLSQPLRCKFPTSFMSASLSFSTTLVCSARHCHYFCVFKK